jgi:hypothetical protein
MTDLGMAPEFNHGRRLSVGEFEAAIIAVQRTLPAMPTETQDRAARRAQLELTIDHRLGVEFPRERRDALWAVQQRIERRRLRLVLWRLLPRVLGGGVDQRAQGLARQVVDEYAAVLNREELNAFFGAEGTASPTLPARD